MSVYLQICKSWFYTPEELTRHMKRHGERNYKCTWPNCNWTFVLSGELKSHMYTHTGEKKYLCDTCGFGAPTRARLRRHVKSHEKSRDFKCDYCPYKANCKVHLKRHMRIHSNSRPFACPYCDYTCNTHENMRKHILKTQKHKGKKLYPCKLCNEFGCDSSKEFKAHLMTVHENWLRENAIDSLAIFSGLYRRDQDFEKPKEGSAVIQVTKGRFFRSYLNPDKSLESTTLKTKKTQTTKSTKKSTEKANLITTQSKTKALYKENECDSPGKNKSNIDSVNSEQQVHPSTESIPKTISGTVAACTSNLQCTEIPKVVMHMNPVQQNPSKSSVPIQKSLYVETSSLYSTSNPSTVMPSQNIHSLMQHNKQETRNQDVQQVSGVIGDSKVFWHLVPDQKAISVITATNTISTSPVSWYSGIPQVHTPTKEQLQQSQSQNAVQVSKSNLEPKCYSSNIPVVGVQRSTESSFYTTGVVENVVIIGDAIYPAASNG